MDAGEMMAEIEKLRADSKAKLEVMTRQGVGDIGLGFARVEMLVELLMPWQDGTNEERLGFELRWEEHANKVLSKVVEQLGRAKLLQGVNGAPLRNGG